MVLFKGNQTLRLSLSQGLAHGPDIPVLPESSYHGIPCAVYDSDRTRIIYSNGRRTLHLHRSLTGSWGVLPEPLVGRENHACAIVTINSHQHFIIAGGQDG